MKVKTIYNNNGLVTIDRYLSDKGIKDIDEYLNPTNKYMENPFDYVNMDDAITVFYKHMVKGTRTYILVDGGFDGYSSASMLFMYMKQLDSKWDIRVGLHTSKQRGLQDDTLFEDIYKKDCDFIIIPDAGSNDKEQVRELRRESGKDVLILDHHEIDTPILDGVLVNNQQGNVDKYGSGCAVTFMFIKALDKTFNLNYANRYVDLVGLSIISDSMNVTSQQNRKYLHYGILHSNRVVNPLLKELISISSISEKNDYTTRDLAFNIVPCINSVCRCDDMGLKQEMFLAFVNSERVNVSEIAKKMKSQHSKQQRLVKDFIDDHMDYIESHNDKSIFIYTAKDIPRNYSGLIAMKICSMLDKPAIIMYDDGQQMLGSVRSNVPIREQFVNNPYVPLAKGHNMAFGIGVLSKDYDKFLETLDTLVIPTEGEIDVFQSWAIKSIPNKLYGLYEPYGELWGHGLEEPTFHVYNINGTKNDIEIIGKNQNTLRIRCGNITLIKFFCSDLDKERFMCYNKFSLEVVGNLNINEWNGKQYPQIVFDKYEIKPQTKKELSDLF